MADSKIDHVAFFARHLVGFSFQTNAPGKSGVIVDNDKRMLVVCGTVMSFEKQWFLATSGHILRQIDQLLAAGYSITKTQLIDIWNWKAISNDPIPFDYDRDAARSWDEPNGFDFGFVPLSANTTQLLQRNGVIAVKEENWRSMPDSMELYMLLGLPSAEQDLVPNGPEHTSVRVHVTLATIERELNPPPNVKKDLPLWYGRIPENLRGEDGAVQSFDNMNGMSGGPILGVKDLAGKPRYWIVGIQSGWDPESRINYAVPTRLIGEFVESLAARSA